MAAIVLVDKQDIAAPGAGVVVFTGVNPPVGCVKIVVTVVLATGSVFNAIHNNGTTARTAALNGGTALVADREYSFDVFVSRMSTDATPLANTITFSATTDSIYRRLNVTAFTDPDS